MRRSLTRREVLKLGGGALAGAYTLALAGCNAHGGGGSQQSASAENYPQQTLDWTIAFGPGGGNDIMSCTLIEILTKNDLYTENIVATNLGAVTEPGAGDSYTTRKEIPTTSLARVAATTGARSRW